MLLFSNNVIVINCLLYIFGDKHMNYTLIWRKLNIGL